MVQQSGGLLRQRDYFILFIVGLTICVCLFDAPSLKFSLEPTWYIDQRAGARGGLSKRQAHFVKPLLTDLDGDGSNELIAVTNDLRLQIYAVSEEEMYTGSGDIHHPEVLQSVRLSKLELTKGRAPIALSAGYIEPFSESQARTKVIVVLHEDWTASAYSSDLQLLWERSLGHKAHELANLIDYYEISDVSIDILPITITDDDRYGVIVIGASMAPRAPNPTVPELSDEEKAFYLDKQASLEHFSM
jgi:hypothetical protein